MCANPPVECDCDSDAAAAARAELRVLVAPSTFSFGYDPGPTGPWWAEAPGHRVEQQASASDALVQLRALLG